MLVATVGELAIEGGHEDTEAIHAHQLLPCSVASGLVSVTSVSKGLVPLVAAHEPRWE